MVLGLLPLFWAHTEARRRAGGFDGRQLGADLFLWSLARDYVGVDEQVVGWSVRAGRCGGRLVVDVVVVSGGCVWWNIQIMLIDLVVSEEDKVNDQLCTRGRLITRMSPSI